MDDLRLNRLETKTDDLLTSMTEVKVTLGENTIQLQANTASLDEHKAQTLEVRKQTQILFEGIEALKKDMDSRVKPVEVVIDRIKFTGVILGIFGGVAIGLDQLGILQFLARLISGHH
jgi:hypothetical protein